MHDLQTQHPANEVSEGPFPWANPNGGCAKSWAALAAEADDPRMEHAFCSAPDPVSSRSASPACEHIRGIVLEDSEIRGIIEEIDDHPDIQWRLPKRESTAGAVLQHSILAVRGLINAEGPLSFKVGITHNAVWRWENQLYGHKQDKRYKWQAMLILHLAEEPYSICMLEAALINHFKGVMATNHNPFHALEVSTLLRRHMLTIENNYCRLRSSSILLPTNLSICTLFCSP